MKHTKALALLAICTSAAAQNVITTDIAGQPLQYMKDGQVTGCGLRMIAGREVGGGRVEFAEVSLNFNDTGATVVKAVSYDSSAAAFSAGRKPVQHKVASAWVKAAAGPATPGLAKAVAGDDKTSLLYATSFEAAAAVVKAQASGQPVQIAVRRASSSMETIFAGRVALTAEEVEQLGGCFDALMARLDSK